MERKMVEGTLTEDQIQVSNELKAMFPEYVNSLGLSDTDGTSLTIDEDGNGSFKDYIKSFVIASAQKALEAGTDLSDKTWITIESGTVTDINYDQYLGMCPIAKIDLRCIRIIENAKQKGNLGERETEHERIGSVY